MSGLDYSHHAKSSQHLTVHYCESVFLLTAGGGKMIEHLSDACSTLCVNCLLKRRETALIQFAMDLPMEDCLELRNSSVYKSTRLFSLKTSLSVRLYLAAVAR